MYSGGPTFPMYPVDDGMDEGEDLGGDFFSSQAAWGGPAMEPSDAGAVGTSNGRENGHLPGVSFGKKRAGKVFQDPVHNTFRLEPLLVNLLDTRPMQRLRHLHQLGCAYYVWPGASHKRFEHSLGVGHLALEWACHFQRAQPQLEITEEDVKMVGVAGLCHDWGHGPFSHLFEKMVIPALGIGQDEWDHEEMSGKLLSWVVEQEEELAPFGEDAEFLRRNQARICSLMTGERPRGEEKLFLWDIVANKRNSVDVDKVDYLQRDARSCGKRVATDFDRLMKLSMVIDNEICFKGSEYSCLQSVFHDREKMHRDVYTNKKVKAVEFMVRDILLAAADELELREAMRPGAEAAFLCLDDTMLQEIQRRRVPDEDGTGLQRAQQILSDLTHRRLYRCVNEYVIPSENVPNFREPTVADLLCQRNGVDVQEEDVIASVARIDFTAKDKNPLDQVSFFNSSNGQKHSIRASQRTTMQPSAFQEVKLRVYSRRRDDEAVDHIDRCLKSWVEKNVSYTPDAVCSTPLRPLPPEQNGIGAKRLRPDAARALAMDGYA